MQQQPELRELRDLHAKLFGNRKIRVAYDCDPGNDDLTAYVSAVGKENIEFLMISASAGNVNRALTLNNALFMVEKSGLDIPVYAGAAHPFGVPEKAMNNAAAAHGSSGLGNLLSKEEVESETTLQAQKDEFGYIDSAKVFARLMHSEKEPFTILATGALTGLAKAFFELQWMLEKEAGQRPSFLDDARNALIKEIINSTSRDGEELSKEARAILNGSVSLSTLITQQTRAFLRRRIENGAIQSVTMMGGVFPETEKSISEAKLDYKIQNIGKNGTYCFSPEDIQKPGYTPHYASPSNGQKPEYGWHANSPIFVSSDTVLKEGQRIGDPLHPDQKVAEFNFAYDPVATQMVINLLTEIAMPTLIVPLNTSHKILAGEYNVGKPLQKEALKHKIALGMTKAFTSLAEWLAKVLGGTGIPYIRRVSYHVAENGTLHTRQMIHDALTITALGKPELCTFVQCKIAIDNSNDRAPISADADTSYPPNQGRSSIVEGSIGTGNFYIIDIPVERRPAVVQDVVDSTLVISKKAMEKEILKDNEREYQVSEGQMNI